MSSVELFNELISMARNTEIHNELTIRDNIVAFLNKAERELGHKLSLEFKHRYDAGYAVGYEDGHEDGYSEGYGCWL